MKETKCEPSLMPAVPVMADFSNLSSYISLDRAYDQLQALREQSLLSAEDKKAAMKDTSWADVR